MTMQTILKNLPMLDISRGKFPGISNGRVLGYNALQSTAVETIRDAGDASRQEYPVTPLPVRIEAGGGANDDVSGSGARSVLVTGIDDQWAIQEEEIITNGTLASLPTTTLFRRILSAKVSSVGTHRGSNDNRIDLEHTDDQHLARITAGQSAVRAATTTVPAGYTMFITGFSANVNSDQIELSLEMTQNPDPQGVAPFTSVIDFVPLGVIGAAVPFHEPLRTYIEVGERTDVELTAARIGGASDSMVSAGFEYILVADSAV